MSYILTCIMIIVFSLLLTFTSIREAKIPMLNTIVMITSIASGGIYVSLKAKEKGWINGGILGISYYMIIILLSLAFVKPFVLDVFTITKLLMAFVTGTISGIIGINIG